MYALESKMYLLICFFFNVFTKKKDEFNTILKHLVKLLENYKPTVTFIFSNISHLSFSPVQAVLGTEVC